MRFRLCEDAETDAYINDEASKQEQDDIEYLENTLNFDPLEDPTDIKNALDDCLETALEAYVRGETGGTGSNLLLIGRAGTGKTSQVKQWARARNVSLVMKDAKTLEPTDIGGMTARKVDDSGKQLNKVDRLSNSEFDDLNNPGTVLFLDEINRAKTEVIGSLLTLILDHTVPDNTWTKEDVEREKAKGKLYGEVGQRPVQGLLFVVAAMNPSTGSYLGAETLDMAMRDRFGIMELADMPDTAEYRRYLYDPKIGKLTKQLKIDTDKYKEKPNRFTKKSIERNAGKIALAKTLLESPMWQWDTAEDEEEAAMSGDANKSLSPRGFSALINACDGTKEDLLKKWNMYCNSKKYDMAEAILENYVDIDDKANSVFAEFNNLDDAEVEGDEGIEVDLFDDIMSSLDQY